MCAKKRTFFAELVEAGSGSKSGGIGRRGAARGGNSKTIIELLTQDGNEADYNLHYLKTPYNPNTMVIKSV